MPLTEDEIRLLVRGKRHGFGFYAAIVTLVVTVIGSLAAVGKWVFTTPTQVDYQAHEARLKTVELDHAVLKANFDGLRNDVSGEVKAHEEFRRDYRVDIRDLRQLIERRR